jgi:hypothetical protein
MQQCSWLRHYATSQKVTGSIHDEVIGFFNWSNPSSSTMAPSSTQPVTEMSTRNLPGGKRQLVHKADNLTAICESIVYKTWEPRCLTTLWASTAYYWGSITFFFYSSKMSGQYLELGHDFFILHPFQFTIRYSSYYAELYSNVSNWKCC